MPLPSFDIEHAPGIKLPNDKFIIESVKTRITTYHSGKANAVKSPCIEKALGISGAKLRAIVNYLNDHSVWVASCGNGYFLAVTDEEKSDYLKQLDARVAGIDRRRNGLRRTMKAGA